MLMKKVTWILFLCYSTVLSAQKTNQVDGYFTKVNGEVLKYFSPLHEFADSSLLTRCNGNSMITMRAEIPQNNEAFTQFRFLIGHSSGTSSANRHFQINLNGKELFVLETKAKRSGLFFEDSWISNDVGYEIQCMEYDINKDVFGYLTIKVPTEWVKENAEFSFTGKDEGSRDWLMVFMHRSDWKFQVEASNLILKNALSRELIVRVDHPYTEKIQEIRIKSTYFEVKGTIKPGYNSLRFPSYPKDFVGTDSIHISIGKQVFHQLVTVQETKNYTFHIIHHSHNDIGYSHLQTEVEQIQNRNIRSAISWIQQSVVAPEKPVWHVESLWAVENFMKEASSTEKALFIQYVRSGNISLSANYANVLTGLSQAEELNWLVEYAQQLEKSYGIRISNAMITDIPGITYDGLNNYTRNHIPYLSLGPNYVENLPDHGDRVGGVIKETGDQVFYWKPSLNSNEKLLVWTAGKGYSYFHNIQDGEKESKWESRISAYVHQLQSSNYPYDLVQLRYTKNADNGPVDTNLCSFVHAWNERYDSPKLVIGNVDSLYQNFEQRYGSVIPVRTGEISPYWEDGAYSTAVEEMANRKLALQTIALDEFARKKNVYSAHEVEFYQLHRNIILFHEHTWGSWCSISDPALFFTTEQWRIKKSFLDSAEQQYVRLSKKLGYEYPESANVQNVKKSKITSFDVDLSTGGITKILVDNENLISENAPYDFMQFIYAKGIALTQFFSPTNITVLEDRENEEEKYMRIHFDLKGFEAVQVSYRWKKNTNRIVVHVEADKTEEFDKESLHIAFPFKESNWKLNYGSVNHTLNYPSSQLPGSNKEFICVSKQVELSDEKHKLILQAPAFSLFEVGSIIQEEKVNGVKVWTRENAPVNPLYLYVLNNYWHTNYKASQSGHLSFDVSLEIE
jgi:alpha-mannosidase